MGLKKLLTNLEQGKLAYPNHNTPSTVGGFNYPEASSIFDSGMTFNQRSLSWGNDEIFNGDSGEPFIRDELLPDRWENFNQSTTLGGQKANNVRGGATTLTDRGRLDSKRIRNFMASPRGVQWKLTQVGLQMSNPKPSEPGVEAGPAGINSVANDGTYNLGINTEAQIAANPFLTGLHVKRGGLTPLSFEGYADEPKLRADATKGDNGFTSTNRLINLYGTHLGFGLNNLDQGNSPEAEEDPSWFEKTFLGGRDFATETALGRSLSSLIGKPEGVVELYKYGGGPGSVYGIGTTTIKKYAPFTAERYTDVSQELIPPSDISSGEISMGKFTINKSNIRFTPGKNMIAKENNQIDGMLLSGALPDERNYSIQTQTGMYRSLINLRSSATYTTTNTSEQLDYRKDVGELGSSYFGKNMNRETTGGRPGVRAPNMYNPTNRSSRIRQKTDMGGNIDYSAYFPESIDKVNVVDIFQSVGDFNDDEIKDFIPFRFEAISHENPLAAYTMAFRAYLDSYNDDYNASHNEFKYNGRAESFFTYEGFTRSISLSFKIAAQSRHEMIPLYRKLNYLVAQTAPEYKGGRMRAPYVRMTVGDICYRNPGLIENINLSWQTDYPWEIARLKGSNLGPEPSNNEVGGYALDDDMLILPHVLDVSLSFKPLHHNTPQRSVLAPFILPFGQNRTTTFDRHKIGVTPLKSDNKTPDIAKALNPDIGPPREELELITIDPVRLTKLPTQEPQMQLRKIETPINENANVDGSKNAGGNDTNQEFIFGGAGSTNDFFENNNPLMRTGIQLTTPSIDNKNNAPIQGGGQVEYNSLGMPVRRDSGNADRNITQVIKNRSQVGGE